MKIISGLFGIPKAEKSHNAAYAKIWSSLLGVELEYGKKINESGADTVYLYMDINYQGTVNLFGGANEALYRRMESFINTDAKFYILDHDMPDMGAIFKGRIGNVSTYEGTTEEFCDILSEKCKGIESIRMTDMITDKLVIGDSHSLSMTPPGWPVIRLDAKTLFGAIRDFNFIFDMIPDSVKQLTLMFGSIDIRHHLFRQNDPKAAARKLYDRYFELVKQLQERNIEVELCAPVPVEFEERKMAKTTMYKGVPFFGSQEDRAELTQYVIEYMKENSNCKVITYPESWYTLDPKYFATEIMEKPRGVHIGFPNYRINNFGKKVVNPDLFARFT